MEVSYDDPQANRFHQQVAAEYRAEQERVQQAREISAAEERETARSSSTGDNETSGSSEPEVNNGPRKLGISTEGFEALAVGMSEQEVATILGNRGKVVVESGSLKTTVYERSFSSKRISITYSNGRLQAKAKNF